MKNNRGLAQIFPLIFLGATLVVAVGAVAFQNGAFKNLSKAGISCSFKNQDQCNAQSDACEWTQIGFRYVCRDKRIGTQQRTNSGSPSTGQASGSLGTTRTTSVGGSGKATGSVGTTTTTTGGSTCPAGSAWSGTACYQTNCGPDEHYDYPHNDKCTYTSSKWVCKCGTGLPSHNYRCLQAGGSMMSGACWKANCPADTPHPYVHNKKCALIGSKYDCNCAHLP